MSKEYLKHLARQARRSFGLKTQFQAAYDEANSCRRKVRYGHKETAIRAAVAMQDKTGDEFQVYECLYCHGGWHIGHSMGMAVTIEKGVSA